MARGTKQRRRTTTSPRASPPDKDNKRVRVNGTLDGFLALATDSDSESNVSKPPNDPNPKISDVLATTENTSTKATVEPTQGSTTLPNDPDNTAETFATATQAADEHQGDVDYSEALLRNNLNESDNSLSGHTLQAHQGDISDRNATVCTELPRTQTSVDDDTQLSGHMNDDSSHNRKSSTKKLVWTKSTRGMGGELKRTTRTHPHHPPNEDIQADDHNDTTEGDSDDDSQATQQMGTTTTPDTTTKCKRSVATLRQTEEAEISTDMRDLDRAESHTHGHKSGAKAGVGGAKSSRGLAHSLAQTDRAIHRNPASVLIPARPHVTRFTLRMYLRDSTSIDILTTTTFKTIFSQLKAIDPSVILYRWADVAGNIPNISMAAAIPTTINQLRPYCNRLQPKTGGGECFTTIRLGTSIHPDLLREQMGWWLQANRHGLWPCALQAENPTCVGWLLYSLREIDLARLSEAITRTIKIPVGLRWRPIRMGRTNSSTNAQTRAIHVDVAQQDHARAKAALQAIYGTSNNSGFPIGIKLRYVPELGPQTSTQLRTKIERLRIRQDHFVNHIVRIYNWELHGIDHVDASLNASMRELLLQIRSSTHQHLTLFHSVDKLWNADGYVLTALPIVESEARTLVAGLLPYLKAMYPQHPVSLLKYFTKEAIERAQQATWDPITQTLMTEDDQIIKDILNEQDDFDLSQCATQSKTTTSTSTVATQLLTWSHPEEQDSVSTLQTEAIKTTGTTTGDDLNTKPPAAPDRQGRHSPQGSTISSITLEERMISLESVVTTLVSHFRQLMQATPLEHSTIRWPGQPPSQEHNTGTPRSAGDSP